MIGMLWYEQALLWHEGRFPSRQDHGHFPMVWRYFPGQGGGAYQSPILVQWQSAEQQTGTVDVKKSSSLPNSFFAASWMC